MLSSRKESEKKERGEARRSGCSSLVSLHFHYLSDVCWMAFIATHKLAYCWLPFPLSSLCFLSFFSCFSSLSFLRPQVCLLIGVHGDPRTRFVVDHIPSHARSIAQEEALGILDDQHKMGHIHTAYFSKQPEWIIGRGRKESRGAHCCWEEESREREEEA